MGAAPPGRPDSGQIALLLSQAEFVEIGKPADTGDDVAARLQELAVELDARAG